MKLSRLIKYLQEINENHGDMQVYAFGYKIGRPQVYIDGEDEEYVNFSRS